MPARLILFPLTVNFRESEILEDEYPPTLCHVSRVWTLRSDKQVQIPVMPLNNSDLDKLLSPSIPQFAHLQNGDIAYTQIIR